MLCSHQYCLSQVVNEFGTVLLDIELMEVWCFHPVTLAFVITMVYANQYDSRPHGNMAQTHVKIVFHIDSLTSFSCYTARNPYLVSH